MSIYKNYKNKLLDFYNEIKVKNLSPTTVRTYINDHTDYLLRDMDYYEVTKGNISKKTYERYKFLLINFSIKLHDKYARFYSKKQRDSNKSN